MGRRYEKVAAEIDRALTFMQAIGADPDEFHRVDFHSSHEALILEYEHAMTRTDSRTQLPYDVSSHFLWIGERTRQLDGAHVELISHIQNPIGVKLGPRTNPDDAIALAGRLNPTNEAGRLTFITRMGAGRIREALPPLLEKVDAAGIDVAWVCDPMHGNTFEASSGYKTRRFDDVIEEVQGFFDVHRSVGTWPGGLHVELTGDDVTECVGGGEELLESDLADRYESVCDPRLNRVQSLELAFLVAEMLRKARARLTRSYSLVRGPPRVLARASPVLGGHASQDGSPHVVPMGIALSPDAGIDPDVAWGITSRTSRKVAHLRADPRIAVSQVDGRRWSTIEGTAEVLTEAERSRTPCAPTPPATASRARTPRGSPCGSRSRG